jgi:hypothetical protein
MAIAAEVRLAWIAYLKEKAMACRMLAGRSFDQDRQRWLRVEKFWLDKARALEGEDCCHRHDRIARGARPYRAATLLARADEVIE